MKFYLILPAKTAICQTLASSAVIMDLVCTLLLPECLLHLFSQLHSIHHHNFYSWIQSNLVSMDYHRLSYLTI